MAAQLLRVTGIQGASSVAMDVALFDSSGSPFGFTNPITVFQATSPTSIISRISASITSLNLVASNPSRKGVSFYNEGVAICYVKFGTTASIASYTVQMDPRSILFIDAAPVYTGQIDGIWTGASGFMQITELT